MSSERELGSRNPSAHPTVADLARLPDQPCPGPRRDRFHRAVTQNYGGKVEDAIALLNHAVATEIVCVPRYKFHAVCATGLASEAVKAEFAQHAKEEGQHLDLLVERINQPGGKPDLNSEGVISRAATEYVEGENLVDMSRPRA